MAVDRDTVLVAVYTAVDDLYRPHAVPHTPVRPVRLRPGHPLQWVICIIRPIRGGESRGRRRRLTTVSGVRVLL